MGVQKGNQGGESNHRRDKNQAAGMRGEEGGEWVRPRSEQSFAKALRLLLESGSLPPPLISRPPSCSSLCRPVTSQHHPWTLSARAQSSLPAGTTALCSEL